MSNLKSRIPEGKPPLEHPSTPATKFTVPDFDDTENAFEGLSNGELRVQKFLFSVLKHPSLVRFGKWSVSVARKIRFPLGWAVKPTIYAHFVGGETIDDCLPVLNRLKRRDVMAVPDYSAEMGCSEKDIVETYGETVASIKFAAEHRNLVSHAVFKAGGLVNVETLIKYAEQPETLSEDQNEEIERFHNRFISLCRLAHELSIRIMIDAEHYAYQGVIDRYTEEAIMLFNKHKVVVFATLQMYRHDRLDYLRYLEELAKKHDLYMGVKFVRGAYMEEERARAAKMGYPDPINPDKATTDRCYDEALIFSMDRLERFEIFNGTHNAESSLLLARLIDEKGLERNDDRIYFSQLFGMSDNISFALSRAGYNVSKYLPYAPVNRVLPYLIRRAEENTAMRGQTSRELALIHKELKRRR